MEKLLLAILPLLTACYCHAQITPTQVITVGNNVIDSSNPRAADIVIGSDVGARHDASLMWWSNNSASRISNTADVFNFSVWNTTIPNVSIGATVGAPSFFKGRLGLGTATPQAALDVNGLIQISGQNLTSPPPDLGYGLFPYGGVGLGIFSGATDSNQGIGIWTNPKGVKTEVMRICANGFVGIGTTSPGQLLSVNGMIHARGVMVDMTGWSDYVFSNDYHLQSLSEVKKYIDENKHLPDVPSEEQVKKEGIDLGDMNSKLLKKIEELTLYLIQQKEDFQKQQLQIDDLKKQIIILSNTK